MKTLIIETGLYQTTLKLKGLSFKAIKSTNKLNNYLCRAYDSTGNYFIDNSHIMNGRTAKIRDDIFIQLLKELYNCIQFDKIKNNGVYSLTDEELMQRVLN